MRFGFLPFTQPGAWRETLPILWRLLVQLLVAALLLALCGVVYTVIEPSTPDLADGLWLAFVTAATVGYGDLIPTTLASKLFSVVVVLLGFGVLSLVTAAIATIWVESHERMMERFILRELHREIKAVRDEVAELRKRHDPP
jgi:voltage-gated potassium channel